MVFFFQFEATPNNRHPDTNDVAGAIVDCWIDAAGLELAKETAQKLIRAEGWIVGQPDQARADDREFYEDDSPHLQYYEQALLDKEVLVFHQYPVDEKPD